MFRRILSLLMAAVLLVSCMGCAPQSDTTATTDEALNNLIKYGENYRPELAQPEEGYLYGMCYLVYEGYHNGIDYTKGLELMKNLGVKSIRHWMHFRYFMKDYKTFDPERTALMHDMIAEMQKYGFQIIGMSHWNWSLETESWAIGKPKRIPVEGSNYYKWLECYEENWYQVVKEFPEITIWEIDNEINNKDFMYIADDAERLMSLEEMAAVSADMLYYASRGIHRANPDAITVMGGIVDPLGLGIPASHTGITMVNYMEALYDCIDSGEHGSFYPDDFFQVAAWHPYYYRGMADDYFVAQNNAIYEVIKRREGKDKKVYLTEFGWNDTAWNEAEILEAMKTLYQVVQTQMPYVESLHYFKAFNNMNNNGENSGLFADPNPGRVDWSPMLNVRRDPGSPKSYAYIYQQIAGGEGPLDLLTTKLEDGA